MTLKWKHVALEELTELDSPITYGVVKPGDSGNIRFIRGGDIAEGCVLDGQLRTITAEVSAQYKRTLLRGGELLISLVGQPGQVAVAPSTMSGANIARQVGLIRLRHEVDANFISYFLRSPDGQTRLGTYTGGSVQQVINLGDLRKVLVPLPSLSDQQRIVALLDEAFDGIATVQANAEKNLRNARALFESHRQSVLAQCGKGWIEKPLAALCDIKHGFAFKSEFFTQSGDHVLLTPGNFYESGGYRDRGDRQKYYAGEIPKGFVLAEGDLLVAMTEQAAGLLGSPILVPKSGKFLHNQRLGLVTPKPAVSWTNEFFFHVFNTTPVRHAIHASATGVKVRHTSPTKIGEVVVSFPTSIAEQRAVVSQLTEREEETQRLESIYQQKLAALAELKKSLLAQAFSGAL